MIINANNKVYVLQGSVEDNGQTNNYYVIYNFNKTYNIFYKNYKGTLQVKQPIYIDVDSKEILKKDSLSYTLNYSIVTSQGVCYTNSDTENLYNLINTYNTDNITVPDDINDSITTGISQLLPDNSIIGNTNISDSASDSNTLYNNSSNDTHNVIDNTLGSSTQGSDKSNLPSGMTVDESLQAKIDSVDESGSPAVGTNIANKGTQYPIIRINDHTYNDSEIQYFSMETGFRKNYMEYGIYQQPITGFLPTMTLIVTSTNKSIIKTEQVKNGDRCAVFFTTGHKMIKSMRCDFRVTNVITNEMQQNVIDSHVTQTIYGELYIPNLRNEKIRYNFNGSARDGLMDAAKRLKLSFFFCDPENTEDEMAWCCCKTPQDFIMDMTLHAWKNDISFFESWIDPRYGLSFQNINKLLGEDGLDEPIDVTIFNKAFTDYLSVDAKHATNTEEETVQTDKPAAKILSNIQTDPDAVTPYHINTWRLFNNAQAIQDYIGLNCKMQFDSINPGMDDNAKYSVETSLCVNRTKCPEDQPGPFYILTGPGKNNTYENADEYMGVSETENSNSIAPEVISQPMSDTDAENIMATNGNMLSSGNTHKFYEVAYQHNMRNLLQLQKQYVICELNGANLSIVRGEKIPVMLMDNDKVSAYIHSGKQVNVSDVLYEHVSGWYIIDGIEWVYDQNQVSTLGTAWSTKVKLTRREWPVPGYNDQTNTYDDYDLVVVNIGNGQTARLAYIDAKAKYGDNNIIGPYTIELDEVVVTAKMPNKAAANKLADNEEAEFDDSGDGTIQISDEDKVANSDIPLTGVKSYLKDLYSLIADESNNRIKLVAGRRWAVDQDGNRVSGNAFVVNHGYYKCINAIGDILYFKKNNSKHLYGEAIDIINSNGLGFNELMTEIIMKSPAILTQMYNNGLSAYIEQAQDDTGVITKHYHIGTDTIKQKEFWNSVKAINQSTIIPGTYIDFSSYQSKNKESVEITKSDVTEILEKVQTE